MKRLKIAGSLILSIILATNAFAGRVETRVRFSKGAKKATVSGSIRPEANKDYVIALRHGQHVTISVGSPCKAHILMEVYGPDTSQTASGTQFYTGQITQSGDVHVRVANGSGADNCRFTLNFNVK